MQSVLLAAAAGQPGQLAGRKPPGGLPDGLTQREAEILGMIARGMTNPDIAAELFLSAHTIKSHINRIFAKTGRPTAPPPSGTPASTISVNGAGWARSWLGPAGSWLGRPGSWLGRATRRPGPGSRSG